MSSHAHVGPRATPRSATPSGGRRRATTSGRRVRTRSRHHTARVADHLHLSRAGRILAAGLSTLAVVAASVVVAAGLVADPAVAQGPATVVRVVKPGLAETPAVTAATVAQLVPTHADLAVQAAVAANPVAKAVHGVKPRFGIDVSWPQCGTTLPTIQLDFAVIGLTDGHADSVNPCLSDQVAWARSQHLRVALYVVPSSPGTASSAAMRTVAPTACTAPDRSCPAYQAGVRQAQHALAAANAARIPRTGWWLDVEESAAGTLWSDDTVANTALLKGWVDALRTAHMPVGAYSTHGYWTQITGGWNAQLPQWVPVGTDGITNAQEACTQPFTSGPVVMTQWLTGPYDGNLLCPTENADPLARAFTEPRWHAHTTAGVPALLTTPVPHPELEQQQADDDAASQDCADDPQDGSSRQKATKKGSDPTGCDDPTTPKTKTPKTPKTKHHAAEPEHHAVKPKSKPRPQHGKPQSKPHGKHH